MVYLLLLILLFQFGSSLEEQQLVAIQNSQ